MCGGDATSKAEKKCGLGIKSAVATGPMAVSVSGEGEDDNRKQEQEAEREAGDCEETVSVDSIGEHSFPVICQDAGLRRARPAKSTKVRRSGSSLSSRGALRVIGKPLIGFCNELHLAVRLGVGHSLSYSARLLGALALIVGVQFGFHGILPRALQFCCNAGSPGPVPRRSKRRRG